MARRVERELADLRMDRARFGVAVTRTDHADGAILPDGRRVAYVQDNDLYVVGIDDGESQRLTDDGSDTVFNGRG